MLQVPKHLYQIELPTGFPLGGSLDVNTCLNATTAYLDTVLWVSEECFLRTYSVNTGLLFKTVLLPLPQLLSFLFIIIFFIVL